LTRSVETLRPQIVWDEAAIFGIRKKPVWLVQLWTPGVRGTAILSLGAFQSATLGPVDLDDGTVLHDDQELSESQPGKRFDNRHQRFAQSGWAGNG
jgi:hypothetical protein